MQARQLAVLAVVLSGCQCGESKLSTLHATLVPKPTAVDFGDVDLGSSVFQTVTLSVDGNRAVHVTSIALAGESSLSSELSQDGKPGTIDVGVPDKVNVRFVPTKAGEVHDHLVVQSDADGDSATLRIPIQGNGVDRCVDKDGDGYGDHCLKGPDCNDNDPNVHPGAPELCDGKDDNCNGQIDEGYDVGAACEVQVTLPDGSVCQRPGVLACSADGKSTACRATPVQDICNGKDDDCDGIVDNGFDVGAACQVPADNGCHYDGTKQCTADGAGTTCVESAGAQLVCCPDGQARNADDACCAPLPTDACQYECDVDVTAGTSTCDASHGVTVQSLTAGGFGTMELDLSGYVGSSSATCSAAVPCANGQTCVNGVCEGHDGGVQFDLTANNPQGYWFHLADSPTCNGWGGDGGQFSNDAEIQLLNTTLSLFGTDGNNGADLGDSNPFVPASGLSTRSIWVADEVVQSFDPCYTVNSPYALRLNAPDPEGAPDALWYVGLNGVYSGESDRRGSGLTKVHLCIR